MRIPLYQVDAFTSEVFSGNPAAVCLLEDWLGDAKLQAIAAENNLSETAFLVENRDGFDLRWFTPTTEVALCGHATLASAFVVFDRTDFAGEAVRFHTRYSGVLSVTRRNALLEMDFPARPPVPLDRPPLLNNSLGITPLEILGSAEDLLVVLPEQAAVVEMQPNLTLLAELNWRGVIVTSPGMDCDFVSRFFAPRVGVPEDPVTGSAHCVLVPYWAQRLDKQCLHARQVSKRGGELICEDRGDRVRIAGKAVLYLEGRVSI